MREKYGDFYSSNKIGLHAHLFAGQDFKIQKMFFENRGEKSTVITTVF